MSNSQFTIGTFEISSAFDSFLVYRISIFVLKLMNQSVICKTVENFFQ
jgi:hypothetical protein